MASYQTYNNQEIVARLPVKSISSAYYLDRWLSANRVNHLTNTKVNSALYPSGVGKPSTSLSGRC